MTSPPGKMKRPREQGYILLTMLLFVTVMIIASAAALSSISFQIRRDREEELIHRAMQYRRAVRQYSKRTGRFPMKLEELENTNGVRYLRKRYKDPLTGKDFRLLHLVDIPPALGTSATSWSLQPVSSTSGSSSADPANNPNGGQGQNQGDGAQAPSQSQSNSAPLGSAANPQPQATFGGGVIIGVASTSSKKTIREFNQKTRYNQWLFFYDPSFDRGFEVKGPTPLVHAPQGLQNAQAPQSGSSALTPGTQNNPGPTSPAPQQSGSQQ